MEKLIGVKWGDLSEETKEFLLEKSFYEGVGACIIDLTENLSVAGTVVRDEEVEIIVDDEAILYDPSQGIVCEARKLELDISKVMTVNEAAAKWGIAESNIRYSINARKFIPGVDYRKAGRITLITREAMIKLYGPIKEDQEN